MELARFRLFVEECILSYMQFSGYLIALIFPLLSYFCKQFVDYLSFSLLDGKECERDSFLMLEVKIFWLYFKLLI